MTEFENALAMFLQDGKDLDNQTKFYNLFLTSNFFLPTVGEQTGAEEGDSEEKEYAVPLVVETEGTDYLILFDSEERLRNWTKEEVSFVEVPGHVLAAISAPQLHWALNVGSEPSKLFQPEEIAWLKKVVARCDAGVGEEGGQGE